MPSFSWPSIYPDSILHFPMQLHLVTKELQYWVFHGAQGQDHVACGHGNLHTRKSTLYPDPGPRKIVAILSRLSVLVHIFSRSIWCSFFCQNVPSKKKDVIMIRSIFQIEVIDGDFLSHEVISSWRWKIEKNATQLFQHIFNFFV